MSGKNREPFPFVYATGVPEKPPPREPHPEQMPGWPDQERVVSLTYPGQLPKLAGSYPGADVVHPGAFGDGARNAEEYARNARDASAQPVGGQVVRWIPPDDEDGHARIVLRGEEDPKPDSATELSELSDRLYRPGDAPHMRFVRLVEHFAYPASGLGRVVIDACKEVWTRVRPVGKYVLAPREEISQAQAERIIRESMPRFTGRVIIASRRELVPHPEWMAESIWHGAVGRHLAMLRGDLQGEHCSFRRAKAGTSVVTDLMIDGVFPEAARRFDIPAHDAVDGHRLRPDFLHPCRDLIATMALCAGWAVLGVPENCRKVADFLVLAAKMPPVVVNQAGGPHLLLLCADR